MNEEQLLAEVKKLRSPRVLHIVYLTLIVACIAGGALLWRSSVEHAKDDARRDVVIEQSKRTIQQAQDERLKLQNQVAAAHQQGDAKLATLQQQLVDIRRDNAAAKREIEAVTGPLAADKSDWPDANLQSSAGSPLNTSGTTNRAVLATTADATLTQDQELKMAERLNDCKQTAVENDTCQLESSLKSELLAKADEQAKAASDAMNAALKASHGGSVWQRARSAFRDALCAGAGGGVGAGIGAMKDKKHAALDAAIGATVGAITCHVIH